jgi:hypothetical protein
MSGVVDGQAVDAVVTNAAFLHKNAADTMPYTLGLSSSTGSDGTAVTSTQAQHNSTSSFLGQTINGAYNALPTWANSYIGSASDPVFTRVNAIVALFGSNGALTVAAGGTGSTTASGSFAALWETVATTLGDLIYGGASGAPTRLAGTTSTTAHVLSQTGPGSGSAAPVWLSTSGSGNVVCQTGATVSSMSLTGSCVANDTFTIANTSDNSKIFAFSLTGMTTGKTLTFSSSQTTNQTLTVPNITGGDTLAVLGLAQTLASKTLSGAHLTSSSYADDNFSISNVSDATKNLGFSLSGMTTLKALTLACIQTSSQTLTIPNITGSDTLATLGLAQTFSAITTFSNSTASSSVTTGALIVTGGIGVTANSYFGGKVVAGSSVTVNNGSATGTGQIQIKGDPTNGSQVVFGSSTEEGSVGTRYSGADAFLAFNAYQNALATDSWAQNATGSASSIAFVNATGLHLRKAASSSSTANFATFFGSDIFGVDASGNATFTAAVNLTNATPVLTITANAANASTLVLAQTSQNPWSIYMPASSNDLRFYQGSDVVKFQSTGVIIAGTLNLSGAFTIGSAQGSTGSTTVTFAATNAPALNTATHPTTWLAVTIGSTVYQIPAWN